MVLEGIEGSGKSTLLTPIKSHFENFGKKVLVTREPGGTELGNELRSMILHFDKENISPLTELFMIEAARAQHVKQVIVPALDTFDLILCDRYTLSTLAYQWGGRNLDRSTLEGLNAFATENLEPNLFILLDLPVETALERRKKRRVRQDRFENEDLAFHEKVRQAYLLLAREQPAKIETFDSALDKELLLTRIIKRIENLLKTS